MAVNKAGGIAVMASLVLASCSGGGSPSPTPSSAATAPPVVTRSYSFPMGDASASAGATAWDIVGVTTTLSGQFANAGGNAYDTLRVDVMFAQNVANALPAPGQMLSTASQLGVAIALDTDASTATGDYKGCSATNTQTPFDYVTDQGNGPSRLADGNYSIFMNGGAISSGGNNSPAEAMVSINGNTFSETFFLTAIGVHAGTVAPKIGLAVVAVNGTGMNASGIGDTDCVPIDPTLELFTT